MNKPLSYTTVNGWNAKVVKDINLTAVVNLKFKHAVLDLTWIESHEHKIKKTPEPFSSYLINEKEVIWQILSHLKTIRWFTFPEVQKHYVDGHHPYPGAIRTYERRGTTKWTFKDEEEVITL